MDDQPTEPGNERETPAPDSYVTRPVQPPEAAPTRRIQSPDESPDPDVTPDPNATRPLPPVDPYATRAIPQVPTTPPPGPDATAVAPPLPPEWKGQAQVRAGTPREDPNAEWVPVEQGRAWWLPILLSVVGLLFIVGIAFAVVYVLKDDKSPAVTPSATATATAPVTPTTSAPVTPSTPPSTPVPSQSNAPVTAVIPPDAVGQNVDTLVKQLDALGIAHHETAQTDDAHPAGTVLSVTPDPGATVPVTQVVQIVYAVPSANSSAPPAGPPPSASASTSG